MSKPVIRPLRLTDFEDLRSLYQELTQGAPVPDGEKGRAKLQEILRHSGTYLLGAELQGQIVAVATLHICPNLTFGGRSYARIENVVTGVAHRGKGLASEVMRALIAKAWQEDVSSIVLLTGKALNARGFYESLGFNAEDKWGMILRAATPAAS